jgi:hypothetical protein
MVEYINGPINFAHLKGSINGINKNIYFFMDVHNDLDNQTRCDSFNSIDISQYLYKKIIEASSSLDFFMEIRSTNFEKKVSNKRDVYIEEVINLFKTEFIIEKIKDNTVVRYSKSNPNVRLHYLDIRDHLELFDVLDIIDYGIRKNIKLFIINLKDNEKKDKYMQNILNNIELIVKKIETIAETKNEVMKNADVFLEHPELNSYNKKTETQKYYLNKIINKYTDKNFKKKIKKFINNYYNAIISNLYILLGKLEDNIEKFDIINEKMLYELIVSIKEVIIDLYSLFTDAFLLRRILDKNYVKKCIVYSGRQHSLNCIFFLVKYYDFKIIKIYDSTEKNVDKLTEEISNADNVFKIYKFFKVDEKNIQCIYYEIIRDGGNRIVYD